MALEAMPRYSLSNNGLLRGLDGSGTNSGSNSNRDLLVLQFESHRNDQSRALTPQNILVDKTGALSDLSLIMIVIFVTCALLCVIVTNFLCLRKLCQNRNEDSSVGTNDVDRSNNGNDPYGLDDAPVAKVIELADGVIDKRTLPHFATVDEDNKGMAVVIMSPVIAKAWEGVTKEEVEDRRPPLVRPAPAHSTNGQNSTGSVSSPPQAPSSSSSSSIATVARSDLFILGISRKFRP